MGWKVPDLSDYLYAVARNGGPIGMSPFTQAKLGQMFRGRWESRKEDTDIQH